MGRQFKMLVAFSKLLRHNFKLASLVTSLECENLQCQRCVPEQINWSSKCLHSW